MHVQFEILFPENGWADEKSMNILRSLLPASQPLEKPLGEKEEVVLGDVDSSRQQQKGATDEDDEREGGPQVQCAQQ